jgi:two-component system, sensor histidine kinase and response regulator
MNRILVIEDDFAVRSSILELLNEEGFETYEAENGKIGIEKAKKYYPDLIISDILMPEVDGYGVLNELQKDPNTSTIPFIFLSARTEVSDIRMGMTGGADDYLTKPYKATDLLDAVHSRLSKKNKSDAKLDEIFKSISMSLPHELRTPLISILGFSQIIQEDYSSLSPEETIDMAENINAAGFNLLSIIEKFLVYSRLEVLSSIKKRYDIVNGSVTGDVKNMILSVASYQAKKAGRVTDLETIITDSSLKISKDHFELLLSEIFENSFKFSKPGSVVEIKSGIENSSYLIKITDHGIGMTLEQINKVGLLKQFDRKINNQNGTGMGLGIINKIAEIYGLELKIESKPGDYTTVKVEIPVSK